MPCEPEPGDLVLLPVSGDLRCKLFHGGSHISKPAMIDITHF